MNDLLPHPIRAYNSSICGSFDEATHTYTDCYGTLYKSVSAIVKSFFPFPRDIKVDPQKSKLACEWGTYIHLLCEKFILERELNPTQKVTYATLFEYLSHRRHEIIGSEVRLFHPELGIAGTCDLLLNIDGRIVIGDFKTNKSLHYHNGFCSHPLSDIDNSTLNGYYYQMSVYAWILRESYGIIADEVEIWWIKPETYEIIVYKSPVMWDWVSKSLPYFCLQPILIDTREQTPIPFDIPTEVTKLDEGDYSTSYLSDKFVIERKSPSDFYGSLIQGHERFRAEILRAQGKGKEIEIWIECPKKTFISKSWGGKSYHLKTPPKTLAKIVQTFSERYLVHIEWCENRFDMRDKMLDKLVERTQHYKSLEKDL